MVKKKQTKITGKNQTVGYVKGLKAVGLKTTKKKAGKNSWVVTYWK